MPQDGRNWTVTERKTKATWCKDRSGRMGVADLETRTQRPVLQALPRRSDAAGGVPDRCRCVFLLTKPQESKDTTHARGAPWGRGRRLCSGRVLLHVLPSPRVQSSVLSVTTQNPLVPEKCACAHGHVRGPVTHVSPNPSPAGACCETDACSNQAASHQELPNVWASSLFWVES